MSDITTNPDDSTPISVFPAVSVSATDGDLNLLTSASLAPTPGFPSSPPVTVQTGLTASDLSGSNVQFSTSVPGLPTVSLTSTVLSSPILSSRVLQASTTLSSSRVLSSSRGFPTSKAVINVIPSVTSLHTSHSLPVTLSHQSSKPVVATLSTSLTVPNSIDSRSSTNTVSSEPQILQSFTFITHSGTLPALLPSVSPSLPASSTSILPIQSPNTASHTSPKHNYLGIILGITGTMCLLAVLASLLVWFYKRRRAAASCSSPLWPTFTNNYNGLAPTDNETREMSYEGSRRFRFPQYQGKSRRPLTFSPPGTVSSASASKIQFPSENSLASQRKVSPPYLLPPSLEQSLTRSLLHERRFREEESTNNKPESTTDIIFKPLTDPIEVPLSLTRAPSVANAGRSPSLVASPIPQIRLETLDTPSTALGSDSDSCSSPFIQFPNPVSDTLLTPRSSAFLVPPTPKYTPLKATLTSITSLPPPPSPSPPPPPIFVSFKTENQQQQILDSKDLEQPGILPERLPSWASSLRTNLFHAVQYMKKRDAAGAGQDQPLSDNSSLYSEEERTSESESLKSSVRSATGTVPPEAKRPVTQRWVVVNGGTERQSVESSCGW